ncbi:hypothetical protein D3C80_765430 [compost metagenome]|jgi:hypothetical protein
MIRFRDYTNNHLNVTSRKDYHCLKQTVMMVHFESLVGDVQSDHLVIINSVDTVDLGQAFVDSNNRIISSTFINTHDK